MLGLVLVFALPLVLASAMISPGGLHPGGLLTYTAIVFVGLPFIGWSSFLVVAVSPPTNGSRVRSLLAFWFGGSVITTAVISFLASVMSYPRPGAAIDPSGHLLIPFAPRTGVAVGLFTLCMLVSCGCWGAISPVLRPEVAMSGALISGGVLFLALYGLGWALVGG